MPWGIQCSGLLTARIQNRPLPARFRLGNMARSTHRHQSNIDYVILYCACGTINERAVQVTGSKPNLPMPVSIGTVSTNHHPKSRIKVLSILRQVGLPRTIGLTCSRLDYLLVATQRVGFESHDFKAANHPPRNKTTTCVPEVSLVRRHPTMKAAAFRCTPQSD